jgi:hypothetical protein
VTWPERESARELRAVAPLIANGVVIGPVTFVTTGQQTIGLASADLLRRNEPAGLEIGIAGGKTTIPMGNWSMGRYTGVGLVQLAVPLPKEAELEPLPIAAACATVEIRGAPAALVAFVGGRRTLIPVHVDPVGHHDVIARLASPEEAVAADVIVDGAPLFAWFPADPALGRKAEVVIVAIGHPYRTQMWKPRAQPALVDLCGLDDLGRALAYHSDERPDLPPAAGEFEDHELADKPPGSD